MALACVACSSGGSKSASPTAFASSSDPSKVIAPGKVKPVNIVMAGADWYVGQDNFVFGITNGKDEPEGGATAMVTFYDLKEQGKPKAVAQGEALASVPGAGPKILSTHADGTQHYHGGEDDNRAGYYIVANFDHAGFWGVSVDVTLKDGTKGSDNFGFQVSDKSKMPSPGQKAIKSDNLTKKDVKDIKEIDSGTPANDMHDAKIKDSIAAGRPVVVVFATPAFCTSRFCGPVTQEVEALQQTYRDKVDFVHIEIWRNFDKKEINSTAREWLVQPDGSLTEPLVYVIDKNGTIFNRWEGPAARNIIEPSVKAVADGATR